MPAKRAPKIEPTPEPTARLPHVGEQVIVGPSGNVYVVSRVSTDGSDVDLSLPGTNMMRFRVPVADLNFVEKEQPRQAKPAKPVINVEEIRERIIAAEHSSVDQFSGDIAVLKKYLRSKGIDAAIIEELDALCEDMEERWKIAVSTISKLL